MCYRYTYIHIWIRRVILKTDEELMDHIYSVSCLCPGLRLMRSGYCFRWLILCLTRYFRDQATTFEDLYYTSHDISEIRLLLSMAYIMPHMTLHRGLILRLTRHFSSVIHHYKYVIIPTFISFPYPSENWVIYYIFSNDNVHGVSIVIQYPWLAIYRDLQEYSIRSIILGVFLL